jgi:hypothetical protein
MQTRLFWLALAGLLSTSPAAADGLSDKFDETLDLSLDIRAGLLGGRDLFTGAEDNPARVRDGARLSGVGEAIGATLRGGLTLDGLRFGLGLGAFRVEGLSLADAPLEVWGLGLEGEAFLGFTAKRFSSARPYIELRADARLITLGVERSEQGGGAFGLGDLSARGFGAGVRAGLLVPLSEYFFLDIAAQYDALGDRAGGLSFGLGLPIPTDNL